MSHDLTSLRHQLLTAMGVGPILAAGLSGCAVEATAPAEAAAVAPLAPPPAYTPGPALTGASVTHTVQGVTPGTRVWFAFGRQLGTGPCPTLLGGACLGMTDARVLGVDVADGSGEASVDVLIPSTVPDGVTVHFQVAIEGSGVSAVYSDVTDHPRRTCGELPELDPSNWYLYNEHLICGPIPGSGTCPPGASLPVDAVRDRWYDLASYPRGGGTGVDTWVTCDEDTIEDRCCYAVEYAEWAIGRPFTVEGHARLADAVDGEGWRSDLTVDVSTLPARVRRRLADAWTHTALGEHASVASFARFQLQLMRLGAPADLVAEAAVAQADEARHAADAFALASAFAGRPLTAGPIDLAGALDAVDLETLVRDALQEGCIAETIAAAQVAAAAEACADPRLRATLEAVAADEARHAALAWRFVRWALAAHPSLRPTIEAAFEAPPSFGTAALDPDAASLRAHGVLPEAEAIAHAVDTWQRVVQPCAQALLEGERAAAA